jgi:hypothetical protein
MIMHQPDRPHPTHPRTVIPAAPLDMPMDHGELLQWLSTARNWTADTAPTWVERLRTEGVPLPSPQEAADADIALLAQRLILSLAQRGVYLAHTDHLSDRELYTYLMETALTIPAPPRQPGAFELIDLCPPYGSGIDLMLACYASDETRQRLAGNGVPIPARRPRLVDRDSTLPRPPEFPMQPH